jgi:hypothetical protein
MDNWVSKSWDVQKNLITVSKCFKTWLETLRGAQDHALKKVWFPGCSNFVELRPELHTGQYVMYGGYLDPYKLKFWKKVFEKDCRIKLALCKLACEIHQPNVM